MNGSAKTSESGLLDVKRRFDLEVDDVTPQRELKAILRPPSRLKDGRRDGRISLNIYNSSGVKRSLQKREL
jgi:hypothetical protein